MREKQKLFQSLKNYFQTAEWYGEEEFVVRRSLKKSLPSENRSVETVVSGQRSAVSETLSKEERLNALYKKYADCQNCPLGKIRTKIVFGMGSLNLKVLFIGEGPGYEEDRQGLPFVGKAGMLLDKIMASIGLDRKSVYIANIVKCHPMKDPFQPDLRGNDRPPDENESLACKPILDEQIEILDPPVICVLGATATKVLMNNTVGISRLRGKVYEFEFPVSGKKIPMIPTYHPAALLRNENLKKDVWHDMKLLREIIQKL